jgi:electron-transferring-flavoprotein dehydrogenase
MTATRESMPYDVVIVGAGPAGLSAAIRLKQLAEERGQELSVCILEKGSEVGAHILSGAVIDPKGLDELLPDWREDDSCLMNQVPVTSNHHWVLTRTRKRNLPHLMMPSFLDNKGTFTGSLGNLCRWLAGRAEALGVEIFPGFAAAEVLFNEDGSVKGVATGDMGVARDGTHRSDYQPGMELHARYTLFAEGARGHLTKEVKRIFDLERDCQPQVYGIGIKELWDIDPAKHEPGKVVHTQGWPLTDTWGGGWIYHQANNQVSIGFVVALSYKNPHLSPVHENAALEAHPESGRCSRWPARVLRRRARSTRAATSPSQARLSRRRADRLLGRFRERAADQGQPHGDQVRHARRRSGLRGGRGDRTGDSLTAYDDRSASSWVADELKMVRNVEPFVAKFGATAGTCSPAPTCGCARSRSACPSRSSTAGSRAALAPRHRAADRLSQAGRCDQLRQAFLRVLVQHQSRGGSADPPHAARRGDPDPLQSSRI